MSRMPLEKELFRWFNSHKSKLGNDAFYANMNILLEENPDMDFTIKKRGGQKKDVEISNCRFSEIIGHWGWYEILPILGNTPKAYIHTMICLQEMGIINHKNCAAGIRRFIYDECLENDENFIAEERQFQTLLQEIKEFEDEYTIEEKKRDREKILTWLKVRDYDYNDYSTANVVPPDIDTSDWDWDELLKDIDFPDIKG